MMTNLPPATLDQAVLDVLKRHVHGIYGPVYMTAVQIVYELPPNIQNQIGQGTVGPIAGQGAGVSHSAAGDVSNSCGRLERAGKVEVLRGPDGKAILFNTRNLLLQTGGAGAGVNFGDTQAVLYRVKPQ